jgi:hypothetical protein
MAIERSRGCREEKRAHSPAGACATQAPEVVQHTQEGGSTKHPTGGEGRRQIPRGRITPISSWRKRPANPLGGGGRGHWGEYFAQEGDGDAHRRQPESASDGGGDPVASELEGERGRGE